MSMAVAPPDYTVPPGMQPSIMPQAQQHTLGLKTSQQKSMKIVSALQVVVGALCILVHSVLLEIHRYKSSSYYWDELGAGIWCGILFVISGTLGLCAARRNTICLTVLTMVTSIISWMAVWFIAGFSSDILYKTGYNKARCPDLYSYSYYACIPDSVYNGYLAADSLLLVSAVVEFILAVWSQSPVLRPQLPCRARLLHELFSWRSSGHLHASTRTERSADDGSLATMLLHRPARADNLHASHRDSIYNGYQAADSLLIIFSVAEFILAVWSSSLGYRAVCCCNSYSAQPVYYMTDPAGGQQVIFMPQQEANGQPMVVSQPCLYTGRQAGNLQGQTTYMPTTGGGDMEKQPLPPGY